MSQQKPGKSENNTTKISGSHLQNSAFATGSGAEASVLLGTDRDGDDVTKAIEVLRQALQDAQTRVDRRDDEMREKLALAEGRLTALEEEVHAAKPGRDWARVQKLMQGIRDSLANLTGLSNSANALWEAIEQVGR